MTISLRQRRNITANLGGDFIPFGISSIFDGFHPTKSDFIARHNAPRAPFERRHFSNSRREYHFCEAKISLSSYDNITVIL